MAYKKQLYLSSSEEEDEEDNYIRKINYPKSAVFNFKSTAQPILEDRDEQLDISRDEDDEPNLPPRMKSKQELITTNSSAVYLKNTVSEHKIAQKGITAAYTFKFKSPVAAKKRKNDPVALFQQTSTTWRKDKFLSSRGNNKEGRKLDLDKRNKDVKTIA